MAIAAGVDQVATAGLYLRVDDLAGGPHRHAEPRDLVVEQREQCAAMDAEAEQVRPEIAVGEIEDHAAVGVFTVEPVDACADIERRFVEPQAGEAGEPGRLEQQPRPHRPRTVEAVEQGDVMPVARQVSGCGQPRRPAPDNADLQGFHRGQCIAGG